MSLNKPLLITCFFPYLLDLSIEHLKKLFFPYLNVPATFQGLKKKKKTGTQAPSYKGINVKAKKGYFHKECIYTLVSLPFFNAKICISNQISLKVFFWFIFFFFSSAIAGIGKLFFFHLFSLVGGQPLHNIVVGFVLTCFFCNYWLWIRCILHPIILLDYRLEDNSVIKLVL